MAKDLISDGLAVSYFYNFVKRLFDNLTENSSIVFEDLKYSFPYINVSLEIIIPKELNDEAIEKCRRYVFQQNEVRLSVERGRDMSFFVENINIENKIIIDFPTTLGAIIEFLKIDLGNLTGFIEIDTNDEEWKEREKSELEKFKEILEFLIKNYSITNEKVIVRYLD